MALYELYEQNGLALVAGSCLVALSNNNQKEGGWDDGGSAGSGLLIRKRRARSVDGLAARKERRNHRRATGLNAASTGLEGARPGSPEGGPG